MGDYLLEPVRYRQLFLDDHGIESWDGCTKALHQPELCGPCIGPHEGHSTPQSRNAPCYNPDEGRWEWWYMGGMATSPDGEAGDWTVSSEPTAAIRSLIRDDNEPDPAKRYKALLDGYRDDNDGGNVSGLTPATSPTGLGDTWCDHCDSSVTFASVSPFHPSSCASALTTRRCADGQDEGGSRGAVLGRVLLQLRPCDRAVHRDGEARNGMGPLSLGVARPGGRLRRLHGAGAHLPRGRAGQDQQAGAGGQDPRRSGVPLSRDRGRRGLHRGGVQHAR
eukprot:COSAG04_NODE_4253_length_2205_cov_0.983856_2_plen_278_part_00